MKKYVIAILQIIATCNAILLGWHVNVLDNKLILRKKIMDLTVSEYDLHNVIQSLFATE